MRKVVPAAMVKKMKAMGTTKVSPKKFVWDTNNPDAGMLMLMSDGRYGVWNQGFRVAATTNQEKALEALQDVEPLDRWESRMADIRAAMKNPKKNADAITKAFTGPGSAVMRSLKHASSLGRVQAMNRINELYNACLEGKKASKKAKEWLSFWESDQGATGNAVRKVKAAAQECGALSKPRKKKNPRTEKRFYYGVDLEDAANQLVLKVGKKKALAQMVAQMDKATSPESVDYAEYIYDFISTGSFTKSRENPKTSRKNPVKASEYQYYYDGHETNLFFADTMQEAAQFLLFSENPFRTRKMDHIYIYSPKTKKWTAFEKKGKKAIRGKTYDIERASDQLREILDLGTPASNNPRGKPMAKRSIKPTKKNPQEWRRWEALEKKAPKFKSTTARHIWVASKLNKSPRQLDAHELGYFRDIVVEDVGSENIYFHGKIDGHKVGNVYIKMDPDDFDFYAKKGLKGKKVKRNPRKPFPIGSKVTLSHKDKSIRDAVSKYMPGKFPAIVAGYSPPGFGSVVLKFANGREFIMGAKDLKRVGKSIKKGVTSSTLRKREQSRREGEEKLKRLFSNPRPKRPPGARGRRRNPSSLSKSAYDKEIKRIVDENAKYANSDQISSHLNEAVDTSPIYENEDLHKSIIKHSDNPDEYEMIFDEDDMQDRLEEGGEEGLLEDKAFHAMRQDVEDAFGTRSNPRRGARKKSGSRPKNLQFMIVPANEQRPPGARGRRRRNPSSLYPKAKSDVRGNVAIPTDAHIVYGHEGETVAYFYTGQYGKGKGKPSMLVFKGKSKKPYSRYYYSKESQRTRALYNFMLKMEKEQKDKEQRKASKKSFKNTFKVGDIIYSSWGYDQTNIDWYVITDATDKSIKYAEIEADKDYSHGYMSGMTKPAKPVKIIGKESNWRRVTDHGGGPTVKVDYRQWAYLWDGKAKSYSSYA